MPYCPNCSAVLKASASGCPECGAERSGPGGWHPVGKPLGGFADPPPDFAPSDPPEPPVKPGPLRPYYGIALGLICLLAGALMSWHALLGPERLPPARALLVLGAMVVMTALIPALLQPRRALAVAAIVIFTAVGASLIVYLAWIDRLDPLIGLAFCGLGLANLYDVWDYLRAKRKAPSSSAP